MADRLSDRVREVLLLLAYGLSAEEAAGVLGVTKATVMFHYRSAADHYGTLNRTHTVVEAIRRGDIDVIAKREAGCSGPDPPSP